MSVSGLRNSTWGAVREWHRYSKEGFWDISGTHFKKKSDSLSLSLSRQGFSVAGWPQTLPAFISQVLGLRAVLPTPSEKKWLSCAGLFFSFPILIDWHWLWNRLQLTYIMSYCATNLVLSHWDPSRLFGMLTEEDAFFLLVLYQSWRILFVKGNTSKGRSIIRKPVEFKDNSLNAKTTVWSPPVGFVYG